MPNRLLHLVAGLLGSLPAQALDFRPPRANPRESPPPTPHAAPAGHVVLVHGFLETGDNFKPLRKSLQDQGYGCLVPRLRPGDGRSGIESLAAGLKHEIDTALGPDQPFTLIGFSMGGLVSRHYLQHLGGASRCRMLVTISSPHHGTHTAWLYPGTGARQMRPGSVFLKDLARSEHRLGAMPVVSYRTPMDLIILPAASSVWNRAENIALPVLMHPLMPGNRAVVRDISRRLATMPRG